LIEGFLVPSSDTRGVELVDGGKIDHGGQRLLLGLWVLRLRLFGE
jgi:hypothetical protein